MKNTLLEFLTKFLVHTIIFGTLIYFLYSYTIQKTVLFAGSFGLIMSFFNLNQKNNKKT